MTTSITHRGSCLPGLKMQLDQHFDLVLGDPPYYSGPEKRGYYGRMGDKKGVERVDYTPSKKKWKVPNAFYFREVKRTSKNWMIFGANYFKPLVKVPFKAPRYKQFDQFLLDHPRGWILWDKCNYANKLADCELILTSFDMPSMIYRYMWNGMLQGESILRGHRMQSDKSLNEKRIHTTQKPVLLYKWLLHTFAFPGAIIGDTHLGSGSSRIGAHDLDMSFEGWEIDRICFKKEEARYAEHVIASKKQLKLF